MLKMWSLSKFSLKYIAYTYMWLECYSNMTILPNVIAMYGLLYATWCIKQLGPPIILPPSQWQLPFRANRDRPCSRGHAILTNVVNYHHIMLAFKGGGFHLYMQPIHLGFHQYSKVLLSWLSMALIPDRYSLGIWRSSHPHDFQRFAGLESCRINNVVVMATYLPVFCMSASSDRI